MATPQITEAILADKWIVSLLGAIDPGPLALLIEDRIRNAATIGPAMSYAVNPDGTRERPLDIIISLVLATTPNFRKRIEPAIGLVLWKYVHNKQLGREDGVASVFHIIRDLQLTNCELLVREWLRSKLSLSSSNYKQDRELYTYALFTLGIIQSKSDVVEQFWLEIWRDGTRPEYWNAAFFGLRKQNIKTAIDQLPLLLSRNVVKTTLHLSKLVSDSAHRHYFLGKIVHGINSNDGISGRALNTIISEMPKDQQLALFKELSALN